MKTEFKDDIDEVVKFRKKLEREMAEGREKGEDCDYLEIIIEMINHGLENTEVEDVDYSMVEKARGKKLSTTEKEQISARLKVRLKK